ncbi:hypothetical protein KKG71_00740 [Patescibacteria group bacterium]|nr:hypothetical protein [Patescibacteria group bacterium]
MDLSLDLRSLLVAVGVLIAAVSLIWNITLHVRQKRKKILVSYSLENGSTYKDNKDSDEIRLVPHRVVVTVKNGSAQGCYLELPVMWLSKKVNRERSYVLLEGGEEEITPELKPGQVLEKHYDLDSFLSGAMSKLKDRHHLRFVVNDTIGNSYKSKKLKVKTLRNFAKHELERCY